MEFQMQQQQQRVSSSSSAVTAQQQQQQQQQANAADKFDSLKACAKRLFHQKNKDLTDVTTQRTALEQLETQHQGATTLLSKGTQKVATLDAELESLQESHSATMELNQEVNVACTALSASTDKIHRARGVGAAVNSLAKKATAAVAEGFTGNRLDARLAEAEARTANSCLPAPQLRSLQGDLARSLNFLRSASASTQNSGEKSTPSADSSSCTLQSLATFTSAAMKKDGSDEGTTAPNGTSSSSLLLPALSAFMEELETKEKSSSEGTTAWASHIRLLAENLRESTTSAVNNESATNLPLMILGLNGDDDGQTSSSSAAPIHVLFPNFGSSDPSKEELDAANQLCACILKKKLGNTTGAASSSDDFLSTLEKLVNTEFLQELANQKKESRRVRRILQKQQKLQSNFSEMECKLVNVQTIAAAKEQGLAVEQENSKSRHEKLEMLKKRAAELEEEESKIAHDIEAAIASTATALTATKNREEDNKQVEADLEKLAAEQLALSKQQEELSVVDASSEGIEKKANEMQDKLSNFLLPGKEVSRKLEETQERELISLSSALRNLDTIEQSNLVAYLPLATAMMEEQILTCSQQQQAGGIVPSQAESELSQQQQGGTRKGKGGGKSKGGKKKGGRRVSFSQQQANNAPESGDEIPPNTSSQPTTKQLPFATTGHHHHHQLQTVLELVANHGPQLRELLLLNPLLNSNNDDALMTAGSATQQGTMTTNNQPPVWCWDLLYLQQQNNNSSTVSNTPHHLDENDQNNNNNDDDDHQDDMQVSGVGKGTTTAGAGHDDKFVIPSTMHPSLADLPTSDPSLKRLGRDVELQLTCRHNEHTSTLNKVNQLISECVNRQNSLLAANGLEHE